MRQMLVEIRFLENSARVLQSRLDIVTAALSETLTAISTLEGTKGRSVDTETLLPIGSGSFVKAKRSEEHTSELQSRQYLVCRLLLEKKHHGQALALLISLGRPLNPLRDRRVGRTPYQPPVDRHAKALAADEVPQRHPVAPRRGARAV